VGSCCSKRGSPPPKRLLFMEPATCTSNVVPLACPDPQVTFLQSSMGNSADRLRVAARHGDADAVRATLEGPPAMTADEINEPDDDPGWTALILAAVFGHAATVDQQLQAGVTGLMLAAAQSHEDVVRVLLEYGADVSITNYLDGKTALRWWGPCAVGSAVSISHAMRTTRGTATTMSARQRPSGP
jgi:ankyrin repeat protein